VPNAQGSNSSYTVTFSNINVSTNFGVSGVTEYSGTIEVVTSIAFPDGTSYSFTYDSGTSPGHYGELTGVTLRTGGTMTYGWTNFSDVYGSVIRWLTSRTYAGGTWTYSPSVISNCNSNQVGCQQKLTETKPSGDEAVYTFTVNNGDWNTETDYYSGSSALMKKVTTTWDFSNPCPDCSNGGTAYVRPIQVVTSMPGPGGTLNSQAEYSYDSPYYGNVTAIKQWNYTTGGFGSTPDREADYTYLNSSSYISANILNRVTGKTVSQSGVQQAQTLTSYDSTPLTSMTGVTHHDDTNYGTGNTVRGNPTAVQQCVSGSTYLTTTNYYDTTGQLVKTTDPAGNSISYSYADNFDGYAPPAPTNAYLTQVTLPISGTIEYTYYFGTGQKASVTDQNLQETIYQFNDPLNRPTETTLPGGAWSLTTYTGATESDSYNNTYAGSPSPSCSNCVHNETLLDEWGRTEDQVLASDPAGATTVATSYDAQDRVTSKSNPYRSTSDPTYGLENYAYDALDRQISNTHADNNVAYTYYGAGITSGGGISSQLCSGASGYPSLSVDEAGHKQQTWTDVFGNPVEVDQEDSTGALSLATCYQHDALNDLASVAQGGQRRSYTYDGLGRETVESTPEAGTVDYYFTASGGGVCAGDTSRVCRRTDARGITTTYAYDAESRLTLKSYSDSTPTAYFVYDESSVTLGGNNYTMTNGKGRLTHTSLQTNNAFTIESYDPAGRIQDLWQCTPFNCASSPYWDMHYQYTTGGYVNDYVHPAGYTITNNISNDGRNEEIQSSLIDSTHPNEIVDMSYAPQGALDHITTGCAGTGCNKLRQNYDYNSRLDLVRVQLGTELNFSSIACWVYNYYASVGNPTACSIPSQGTSDDGNVVGTYYNDAANSGLSHTAAYSYDPTHRLTSAVAAGNATYNLAFSFDQYGNMTCSQNQNTNGPCPQYSFNSSTNQISNSGYTYDASGDLTNDGTHTYQYDAEGRLISVDNGSTATYVYNALGERVEKSVGGTYTEYVFDKDGNPVGENNRTTWTDTWVIFDGKHVAHYENGVTYFIHANSVGTTAFVTDYTGAVVQDELHYPWGQEWTMQGTMEEERFASLQHRDAETGLDPTLHRVYASGQGRWFTPDPVRSCPFHPENFDRYNYVAGSPTNHTDPQGLASPDFFGCSEGYGRCLAEVAITGAACYVICLQEYGVQSAGACAVGCGKAVELGAAICSGLFSACLVYTAITGNSFPWPPVGAAYPLPPSPPRIPTRPPRPKPVPYR
jgi:RHS repeat-associated protein